MKEKKRTCFTREILSFLQKEEEEDFFEKKKRDKTNKRSVCSQKCWIEWKRMEQEEKRNIFPGKFCEGEW